MSKIIDYMIQDHSIAWPISDKPLFCDIETHGLYLEVCLFQMYQEGWDEPIIIKYPDLEWLKEVILNYHTVWYNASYDLGTLGISPDNYDDLFYAAKTAYPLLDNHKLDTVEEHLGITCHDWVKNIKDHLGITWPRKVSGKIHPHMTKSDMQPSFASAKCKNSRTFTPQQLEYAAADTIGLAEMWPKRALQRVIKDNLAYKADIQAQKDALEYQYNGMPIAKDRLDKAIRKSHRHRRYHHRFLPKGMNVKSPKLKDFLGTANANEQTLKMLDIEGNPDAMHILNARKYRTRLQDLEKKYSGHDRIKTFFNAAGAVTGRFTSTGGAREGFTNIQNINRDLKYIFGYHEDSDRIMVNADYSTAELIAGCSIFKVPTMKETILDGLDLHKDTATWLAGVKYEDVTKQQRQAAKAVNFGLLFGMGIELFISYAYYTYGVKFTRKEAERAKELYYKTHPGIRAYHDMTGRMCRRNDYTVETALGRVAGNKRYTELLNIPVQGSIAEATKVSISHFKQNNRKLLRANNMIVNMVHDSIVGDIRKCYIEDWSEAIKESMQYGWRYVSKSDLFHYQDLPMGVDVEVCHEYGGEYEQDKVDQIIKAYR